MKKRHTIKIILVVVLVMFALYQLSKSRTFQFFSGLTSRVQTPQKVVALTFDDTPGPKTPEVLEILRQKIF